MSSMGSFSIVFRETALGSQANIQRYCRKHFALSAISCAPCHEHLRPRPQLRHAGKPLLLMITEAP